MGAPLIELVYFTGCPHVEEARVALRAAIRASGIPVEWREWDQSRPETPTRVLRYGSPTLLVNGLDITGNGSVNEGRACRADGIPNSSTIEAALTAWRLGTSR